MRGLSVRRSWAVLAAVFFAAMAPLVTGCAPQGQAKYVFLFIGDGMGPAQRRSAEIFLAGPQDANRPLRLAKLAMNTLPYFGMARTNALTSTVTDSAASGTAMATGHKVPNGVVSLDRASNMKYTTLAEIAQAAGWKVGIVSSTSIDDATPAAFYAHQPTRGNRYEIAMELAGSGFDYFAGGAAAGTRVDPNLPRTSPLDAASRNGYSIVTGRDALLALKPGCGKVWSIWTKPDGNHTVYYEMDRPADQPSLREFTRKGIELLDNPKGFFMMVEGGLIDGACHAHDLASSVRDTLAFDEAVAEALEFYEKHPAETLIVVTCDHETGGMGLNGSLMALHPRVSGQKGSQGAFGRQAQEFREKQVPFEQALPAIQEHFGFGELSESSIRLLAAAYAETLKDPNARPRDSAYHALYARLEPISVAATHLLGKQAGVAWTTWGHTDMPAPVTAIGAGAEAFTGYYENSDLFHKIRAAMAVRKK